MGLTKKKAIVAHAYNYNKERTSIYVGVGPIMFASWPHEFEISRKKNYLNLPALRDDSQIYIDKCIYAYW